MFLFLVFIFLLAFLLIQTAVHETTKASEHVHASGTKQAEGLWKDEGLALKPCWDKPVLGESNYVLENSAIFYPLFLQLCFPIFLVCLSYFCFVNRGGKGISRVCHLLVN